MKFAQNKIKRCAITLFIAIIPFCHTIYIMLNRYVFI